MSGDKERLAKIRAMAVPLAVLCLLVVLVSAYMRLSAAGLGCADWPACYGRLLASEPTALQLEPVRLVHRLTATAALVLAGLLVWRCRRPQPLQPVARYASLLLLLMLALSTLGIWSADPRLSLVNFLNIIGGLGLVTFAWRVVLTSRDSVPRTDQARPTLALRLGLAVLTLTVVLGCLIGARYAALSCTSFPDCGGLWWPPAEGWAATQPFGKLSAAPLPGDPGGVTLHLLHRYVALSTFLLLGIAGVQALKVDATRKAAQVVLSLLVIELVLGVLTVISGLNLCLAVAHGTCAAALLAAVASLTRQ